MPLQTGPARTVVVTGASSGIGRATALALADRGDALVLASRGTSALEDVAEQCRARGASRAVVVPTDVADAKAVDELVRRTLEEFGRIDAVVNSAAVVSYGRLEDVPADVFDQVHRTNVSGTVNVARAVLPVMRRQGRGTLVLLGSLLGGIATPYLGTYVSTKWAVHALARVLHQENLDVPGVSVCVVEPGGVDTPVYRQAANYAGRIGRPPPPVDPPEKVAARIVGLLDRPRRRASVGPANPITVLGFRLLPGVYDRLVGPLMRLGGLSRTHVAPHAGNVFEPTPAGETLHR